MLKLLKKYLKGTALLCAVLAPLSMLLEVFMDLQQPALMSDIIDIGVANGDLNYVVQTGGRMVIYALLGLLGGAGCSVLATYASVQTGGRVRKSLFSKIQSLSFAEIDRLETSSLVTRLTNDIMQMQEMIMMILRSFVRSPMLFLGGIYMSFRLSPSLALILCVILPVLAASAILIISKAIPMYSQVQKKIDQVNTVVRENLLGIRVVKAFTMENQQFNRFSASNDALITSNIKAQSVTFLLMPIVTLVMNLSIVAVLWFGGNMEISGSLPTGKIMAMINYMIQITNALVMLVNMVVNVSRSQASAVRIQEVFDTDSSILETDHPAEISGSCIEFSDVCFRYGSGGNVLDHISFTLEDGHRAGIIGATGSGKSTLVNLLIRLYDVNSGSIKIGSTDIRDIPLAELRKKVGIVFQDSLLFSGTVADNLRYGNPQASDEMLTAAADKAQASAFLSQIPEQLASYVEQRGKNFSGGQKQRLSIARTLLQQPDILILDDSSSALDFLTEAQLQEALKNQPQKQSLLIIAQRISSIMDCDTILVLDNGRLTAKGTHQELLQTCTLYRSIAVSQIGEEALDYVS